MPQITRRTDLWWLPSFSLLERASSILWPPKSLDIMSMTSIWNKFVRNLNHSTSIVSNTVQLWGDMEDVWADFIFNIDFIDPKTVGYVWVDLGRIVDDIG